MGAMSRRELMGVSPEFHPQYPQNSNSEDFEDTSVQVKTSETQIKAPSSESNRWPEAALKPLPLRRCGSLVCPSCRAHRPSAHKPDCISSKFEACRSPWFWLSPRGAIKCIACAAPDDLGLIEAWVLARENEEAEDDLRIPCEILALMVSHGSA
jgi:hypothetical protein